MTNEEHYHQVALINICKGLEVKIPALEMIFAIPNGGLRNIAVARKLKLEGVKPGVPDLFLPDARGGYHGLFIEMKSSVGRVSGEQVRVASRLMSSGYIVNVCRSAQDGMNAIYRYLELK